MRRLAFRAGIALGVVLVAAGAVVGYLGYEHSSGPAGAVRGYFSAIADGDAPRALAWGAVPSGPHTLLTSDVLHVQQRIAPLRDLQIVGVDRAGAQARVHVSYQLAFPGHPVTQRSSIDVVDRGGDWRLSQSAVATQLLLSGAAHRAQVLGAPVPQNETLAFPGAVPVTFDTPYLQLDGADDTISFGGSPVVEITVQLTAAARTAVLHAVLRNLAACYSGTSATTDELACPLPAADYVPGSLHGTISAGAADELGVTLAGGDDGLIDVDGTVAMQATTYQRLTFANRARTGSGSVELSVHAETYPTQPLHVVWRSS